MRTSSTHHASPSVERWLAVLVLVLAVSCVLGSVAKLWRFTTDDTFITLRYSRHLAAGQGLVWNVGEPPVEGYSNPLYVLFGAVLLRAGWDPLLALKLLGVASLLATCLLLYPVSRTWLSPLPATLPSLLFARSTDAAWWGVSGLEPPFFQLLVLAAGYCFLLGLGYGRADHEPGSLTTAPRLLAAAGGLGFLASLTRPEGPLVLIGMLGALWLHVAIWQRRRTGLFAEAWTATRVLLLSFALPYAVYFVARWSYFGQLLPHSVQCKAVHEGPPWYSLAVFWDRWKLCVCLALLQPLRRVDARLLFCWSLTIAYAVILYGIEISISYNNHYYLTAVPLLLVAAAAGLRNAASVVAPDRPRLAAGALVLVVVAGALALWPGQLRAELPATAVYERRMATRYRLGTWLDARLRPTDAVALGDCGLVPYLFRGKVIDLFCLNDRTATEPAYIASPARYVDAVVTERRPAVIVVHSADPDRIVPRPEFGVYPLLLQMPALWRDYELAARFVTADDEFHYFIFRRRDFAPLLPFTGADEPPPAALLPSARR